VKSIQLFEFEDFRWFPGWLRSLMARLHCRGYTARMILKSSYGDWTPKITHGKWIIHSRKITGNGAFMSRECPIDELN